ncbi:MAG TPA: hypothetical protein P5524_01560 [Candidatus Paceibacterota bacterium]|nr:hypothetical protein [Candidatus Paceibacterota bacterium]
MEPELIKKIDDLERKIDESTRQLNQLRRYFLWTLIISAAAIILPLVGLIFLIPKLLSYYQGLNF